MNYIGEKSRKRKQALASLHKLDIIIETRDLNRKELHK
jgi:hypothetical protein